MLPASSHDSTDLIRNQPSPNQYLVALFHPPPSFPMLVPFWRHKNCLVIGFHSRGGGGARYTCANQETRLWDSAEVNWRKARVGGVIVTSPGLKRSMRQGEPHDSRNPRLFDGGSRCWCDVTRPSPKRVVWPNFKCVCVCVCECVCVSVPRGLFLASGSPAQPPSKKTFIFFPFLSLLDRLQGLNESIFHLIPPLLPYFGERIRNKSHVKRPVRVSFPPPPGGSVGHPSPPGKTSTNIIFSWRSALSARHLTAVGSSVVMATESCSSLSLFTLFNDVAYPLMALIVGPSYGKYSNYFNSNCFQLSNHSSNMQKSKRLGMNNIIFD